jgi:hypothetical protein
MPIFGANMKPTIFTNHMKINLKFVVFLVFQGRRKKIKERTFWKETKVSM